MPANMFSASPALSISPHQSTAGVDVGRQGQLSSLEYCKSIVSSIKDRPNFGFDAEDVDCNTFGILSVSAESSHDTFGETSVSATGTPNFGGHRKYVYLISIDISRFQIVRVLDLCSHSCRRGYSV